MAIRQWHPGQLVVLWVAAACVDGLIALAFMVLIDRPASPRLPLTLATIFIVIPFVMLVVTWRWFGGRRLP